MLPVICQISQKTLLYTNKDVQLIAKNAFGQQYSFQFPKNAIKKVKKPKSSKNPEISRQLKNKICLKFVLHPQTFKKNAFKTILKPLL